MNRLEIFQFYCYHNSHLLPFTLISRCGKFRETKCIITIYSYIQYYKQYYYIMILFKQFDWLSCCHLTFRIIWYCLIKTRIDLVSLSGFFYHCIMYDVIMKWLISYWLGFTFTFHFNVIKQRSWQWVTSMWTVMRFLQLPHAA
jgi:hypothetical protein